MSSLLKSLPGLLWPSSARTAHQKSNNFAAALGYGYDAPVIAQLGYRGVHLAVLFFAALGFFYVPLGKKTGFEHTVDVLSTDAARDATAELFEAGGRLRDHIGDIARKLFSPGSEQTESEPQSQPPRLGHIEIRDAGADVSLGNGPG